jgi:hypothetical protein
MPRSIALAFAVAFGIFGAAAPDAEAFGRRWAAPGMELVLCVDDPCDCCGPQEVCVCVPCCCTEPPTVCWRDGIFGRRVATYVWQCCGYSVDVVLTRRGDVIVRG